MIDVKIKKSIRLIEAAIDSALRAVTLDFETSNSCSVFGIL